MTRRPSWIPPRRAIPKATIVAVLKRSKGVCEVEGCDKPAKEFNHKKGVAFGGGDGPDDIEHICVEHHKPHTKDVTQRALKADKQAGRCGQYARRKKAKAAGKHRSIKSPGFQTNKNGRLKRKLDGTVERRT